MIATPGGKPPADGVASWAEAWPVGASEERQGEAGGAGTDHRAAGEAGRFRQWVLGERGRVHGDSSF
jgi:hypothetical protein